MKKTSNELDDVSSGIGITVENTKNQTSNPPVLCIGQTASLTVSLDNNTNYSIIFAAGSPSGSATSDPGYMLEVYMPSFFT